MYPTDPFTPSDVPHLAARDLHRAVREGAVRRVLRGVYVRSDVPDSYDLRLASVRRAVSPGHIAIDRTAAWLHGIDLLSPVERDGIPPIEVCRPRSYPVTQRSDVLGRNRDLVAHDVLDLEGLLVTTPLRTALDLGCVLQRRDALAALDQFRRLHEIEVERLRSESARYFRRRGVIQLRELIPLADPRSESVRESWTRLAIIDAGLPVPVPQFEVVVDGVVLFRLDLAYPRHRVAVEYDGHEFHHTEEQLAHDHRRRAWLRAHGWVVIVVRRGDFSGPQQTRWLDDLRRALRTPYSPLRW